MQTNLAEFIKNTEIGKEADAILRRCVHCGFCSATCPTYQLLGDELDGPRGRIYLIKQMLEGSEVTAKTQLHLDRCLTCQSCETTCPSGVRYARLVDIGREVLQQHVQRPLKDRLLRRALLKIIPYPQRFRPLVQIAQFIKPVLSHKLQKKIPKDEQPVWEKQTTWYIKAGNFLKPVLPQKLKIKIPDIDYNPHWPKPIHGRKMLVFPGCAQSVLKRSANDYAAKILDRLGISVIEAPKAGCCGAVSYHLSEQVAGLDFMRRNIDAWWSEIETGVEAIVITASACGVMLKDYGELLKQDPDYAQKAARISVLTKDISEVLAAEDLDQLIVNTVGKKVAFQSPCTLQHGQKLGGVVEKILIQLGFELTLVNDSHLCCGSAGTYSVLQPELSQQLEKNKLNALQYGKPNVIATANIGCHMHLEKSAQVPVKHWLELLSED